MISQSGCVSLHVYEHLRHICLMMNVIDNANNFEFCYDAFGVNTIFLKNELMG